MRRSLPKRLFVIILIIFNSVLILCQNKEPVQWTLGSLITKDYDKYLIPSINGSRITVSVGIEIFDLVGVVESGQHFIVDLVFNQRWRDTRLNLPFSMQAADQMILDSSWSSRLWTPDTYFSNALESKILNVVNPIVYLTVSGDKYVTQSIRMNVKFQCKMDLSQYPQDVQHCPIDVISLTRNSKSLQLEWDYFKSPPLDDNPKFRLRQTTLSACERYGSLGHFKCLTVQLKLVRRVSYYMIRIYAPTFLTTISSFLGFWIPVMAWPARVALLVTPLLTLVTQNVNINSEINVSYVVALHWWMALCIFFVFMSLIEFCVAISWAWMANDKKALRATQGMNEQDMKDNMFKKKKMFHRLGRIIGCLLFYVFGNIDYTKDPLGRNKVDYASRILFPFTYILFVIIYVLSTICPWAVAYNW